MAARNQDFAPYLKGSEGTEFRPLSVGSITGILPFEQESDQTLCGESIINTEGDMNVRMSMDGYCTLQQLGQLFQLRDSPEDIELVWQGSAVTNISLVSFDQIRFDIEDGEDRVHTDTEETLVSFQLQSKEDTSD